MMDELLDMESKMHDLYKTGDASAPEAILDRNGHVALRLCKVCGKGEIELAGPCANQQPAHRVVQSSIIEWANGLHGKPTGADIAALIKTLTQCILMDRIRCTPAATSNGD